MIAGPLLLLWLAQPAAAPPPAPAPSATQERYFPHVEDTELLSLAGLPPAGPHGNVIRYSLRRGFGYATKPTARIVQVQWPFGPGQPRVVLVEFAKNDEAWRIVERREALMHPLRYEQLVRNVMAAASAPQVGPGRGTVLVCSHSDSSRLDLRLPDQGDMLLIRTAHCSDDAPAVVAGELLAAAAELSLRLNWTPDR
jgi:hypothetical protein